MIELWWYESSSSSSMTSSRWSTSELQRADHNLHCQGRQRLAVPPHRGVGCGDLPPDQPGPGQHGNSGETKSSRLLFRVSWSVPVKNTIRALLLKSSNKLTPCLYTNVKVAQEVLLNSCPSSRAFFCFLKYTSKSKTAFPRETFTTSLQHQT